MKYSASKNAFFPPEFEQAYLAAGTWPDDLVDVPQQEYANIMSAHYSGKQFVPDENGRPVLQDPPYAPASTPSMCTPAQGLVALFALKNITEDDVKAAIATIRDPVEQYTARIGFQHAKTWERGSPTMLVIAQLLALSDEDLDALFTYTLNVRV